MNQESVGVTVGNSFSKLLQGPGSGWISSDIAVQNAAGAHFHDHQDIQQPEACRDRHQEIGGHYGLGVVADERSPVQ